MSEDFLSPVDPEPCFAADLFLDGDGEALLGYDDLAALGLSSFVPRAHGGGDLDEAPRLGFAIEPEDGGEPLVCRDVRGFDEAARAAIDPSLPVPARLVLVAQSGMCGWLDRWSEDEGRVHRTLRVRSEREDTVIEVIATLSSYGPGVDTQLAVASVSARAGRPLSLVLRSGVHSKADVEAALARWDAEHGAAEPAPDDPFALG